MGLWGTNIPLYPLQFCMTIELFKDYFSQFRFYLVIWKDLVVHLRSINIYIFHWFGAPWNRKLTRQFFLNAVL